MDPELDRPDRVAEPSRGLGRRQALSHQKHGVKAMIIAGLFGTPDFILQSRDPGGRILDSKRTHQTILQLP